jgi:hypothetical protein
VPRSAALAIALMFLAPAAARAALQLSFDGATRHANNTFTVEVVAYPTDLEDEQLAVFDIGFILEPLDRPAAQRVLSFAPPYATRPANGFVFGDDPAAFVVPSNPGPGPGWFLLNVEAGTGTALPGITGPVRLATLHIGIGPDELRLGDRYRLRFDERFTVFSSGDPTRLDTNIQYTISTAPDSGLIALIPEPSVAGLMLAGAALALCRRR